MKNLNDFLTKYLVYIFWFSIILTVFAPRFLTFESPVSWLKLPDVGDTIGGTTAPIIGILNAILLYLAFNAQLKANDLLLQQREDDEKKRGIEDIQRQVDTIYLHISDRIINFRFKKYSGSKAIYKLFDYWYCGHHKRPNPLNDPKIAELYSLLQQIYFFTEKIKELDSTQSETYSRMINIMFNQQIMIKLLQIDVDYINIYKCDECSKKIGQDQFHGLHDKFIVLIEELVKRLPMDVEDLNEYPNSLHQRIYNRNSKPNT